VFTVEIEINCPLIARPIRKEILPILGYMLVRTHGWKPRIGPQARGETNMTVTWVVTADSTQAHFYEVDRIGGEFKAVKSLNHAEGKKKGQDLTSDRPGRAFDSAGLGRHAMSSQVNPREHEAEVFAREVCEALELGRTRGSFQRLIVLAPPDFLGKLRKSITSEANKLVAESVPKSVVGLGPDDIRRRIKTLL
jgi:protein required for attachment to host cells